MYKFLIDLKHDAGATLITTSAASVAAARDMVMKAEGCPSRALRRIRAVDEHGFEMLPENPTQRRILKPPAANIRETDIPGYRVSASKLPTRYEVLIDKRWRRVFTTRHTGLQYVIHDGLNVQVDLPKDLV
jgi:hypothetical protein